jgi:hypothetical protein
MLESFIAAVPVSFTYHGAANIICSKSEQFYETPVSVVRCEFATKIPHVPPFEITTTIPTQWHKQSPVRLVSTSISDSDSQAAEPSESVGISQSTDVAVPFLPRKRVGVFSIRLHAFVHDIQHRLSHVLAAQSILCKHASVVPQLEALQLEGIVLGVLANEARTVAAAGIRARAGVPARPRVLVRT